MAGLGTPRTSALLRSIQLGDRRLLAGKSRWRTVPTPPTRHDRPNHDIHVRWAPVLKTREADVYLHATPPMSAGPRSPHIHCSAKPRRDVVTVNVMTDPRHLPWVFGGLPRFSTAPVCNQERERQGRSPRPFCNRQRTETVWTGVGEIRTPARERRRISEESRCQRTKSRGSRTLMVIQRVCAARVSLLTSQSVALARHHSARLFREAHRRAMTGKRVFLSLRSKTPTALPWCGASLPETFARSVKRSCVSIQRYGTSFKTAATVSSISKPCAVASAAPISPTFQTSAEISEYSSSTAFLTSSYGTPRATAHPMGSTSVSGSIVNFVLVQLSIRRYRKDWSDSSPPGGSAACACQAALPRRLDNAFNSTALPGSFCSVSKPPRYPMSSPGIRERSNFAIAM